MTKNISHFKHSIVYKLEKLKYGAILINLPIFEEKKAVFINLGHDNLISEHMFYWHICSTLQELSNDMSLTLIQQN